MTDQDRQYMVDVDDPNLAAFLAWHRDATQRGVFRDMSWYSQLKMAWMAARNSRWQPPPPAPLPPAPPRSVLSDVPAVVPGRKTAPAPDSDREWDAWRRKNMFDPLTPSGQWPAQSPERHREAQRFVETQAMPTFTPHGAPDPFASVRLSGPQQAALDSLYPDTVPLRPLPDPDDLADQIKWARLPVTGPVEEV